MNGLIVRTEELYHPRLEFVLVLGALLLSACSAPGGTRPWGADVTLRPGWPGIGLALKKAATDTATWVPTAGAAVLFIGTVDEDIAEWAADETPLFGSRRVADDYSSDAKNFLFGLSIVSSLATWSGPDIESAALPKLKGLLLLEATALSSRSIRNELKKQIGRERPDGRDRLSMPSGHTSTAFTHARWIIEDLDYLDLPSQTRTDLQVATWVTAASVGWARVEANRHYPTDVLLGAALGNFVTVFFREAFFEPTDPDAPSLAVTLDGSTAMLGLRWRF